MQLNTSPCHTRKTHEGAPAYHLNPELGLKRSVLACLLWEDAFYESGESIADRIQKLAHQCNPQFVSALAIEARDKYRLRHAPLWLARALVNHPVKAGRLVGDTLYQVIQRPDEITEFLAQYWKDGKRPLAAQVKKGIARAFHKFDEYQLAKYNRAGAVKLKDALFLCHAKAKDIDQSLLWKRLIEGSLSVPDTWETGLSTGGDKKETFTRLLQTKKLGYMALLRNLRNMEESGVDRGLVSQALMAGAGKSKALPFRFIAAAKAAISYERELDAAMLLALNSRDKLPGHTRLLVDVSGSMNNSLSGKSTLTRMEAAGALAALLSGISLQLSVFSFSMQLVKIPPRQGMALIDAIRNSQPNLGTYLGAAVTAVDDGTYDRLIVLTDEQSHDPVPPCKGNGYMINVAAYENGVGYGAWHHITGWSEAVVDYIQAIESENAFGTL